MLKKISVTQLVVGMHLKAFCGSWMDHPFWRNAFLITDAKDIDEIRASAIKEVWIDCSKGCDVAPDENAVFETESEEVVDAELSVSIANILQTSPSSAAEEYPRAAKICARAKAAVISLFQEVRMGRVANMADVQKVVQEISDSISRNPGVLVSLVRLKSVGDYTYMHSVAVCALMVALGRQLQLDDEKVHAVGIAGLLHDLGKAMIPPEIINKPGKLTEAEFDTIKTHPAHGSQLLKVGKSTHDIVFDVVLHHHEKMDGSGYPDGLKGEEISLFAKMGAVCDVYDAITSNRPYKAGWCPAESLRKMAEWTDTHFDPMVFQSFVKSIGIYPIGSLVSLSSGRLGIVVEQSEQSLLAPHIKVFFSIRLNTRIRSEIIDLSLPECTEQIIGRENPEKWNFLDINQLWLGQTDLVSQS